MRDTDIQFEIATPSHDSAIRQLLRECPMPGKIGLSLQREPSFFKAAAIESSEHHAIIAVKDGRIVALGSVSVRQRFINGKPIRIGYLGSLRLHRSYAGRFDILRRGYRFLRELHGKLDVPFYLTSIAADNKRASHLLERGLPEMPLYKPAGDLATVLLRTRPQKTPASVQALDCDQFDAMLDHLNGSMSQFQFAPSWTRDQLDQLRQTQIPHSHMLVVTESDRIVASASLWDQRSSKQTVITSFPPHLSLLRPLWNAVAPMFHAFPLPAVGKPMSHAFVSHLACPDCRPELFDALIGALSARAYDAGIEMLSIGLDARDPRLQWIRRAFTTRTYATRLYTVHWPADSIPAPLDTRLLYPEVALL